MVSGDSSAAPAETPNTRSARRFPMQLPASVKYGDTMLRDDSCETRDISAGGVYFYTHDKIPMGAHIEMVLPMPQQFIQNGKLFMFCQGRVVRHEPAADGRTGIGAVIEGYKILSEA